MRIVFSLFLIAAGEGAFGSFSESVLKTPCTLLSVNAISCEVAKFSSETYLPTAKVSRGSRPFVIIGAVLRVKVENSEAVRCRPTHVMDPKLFRPVIEKEKKLLIPGLACAPKPTRLKVILEDSLCDTPGSWEVENCFREAVASGESLRIGRLQ